MYYQSYEDYMRSVLGYPVNSTNTYDSYNNYQAMPIEQQAIYTNSERYSDEIMNLYPEIYKIISPMVGKLCEVNTKPITRELIDTMTDEIYINLENQPELDTIINVRVNTPIPNENKNSPSKLKSESKENREAVENRESRQRRNPFLQDLIRIMILNRLLGNSFPNRPQNPRPPMPPRPPYPRYNQYFG